MSNTPPQQRKPTNTIRSPKFSDDDIRMEPPRNNPRDASDSHLTL
jgi:hypothetical protein